MPIHYGLHTDLLTTTDSNFHMWRDSPRVSVYTQEDSYHLLTCPGPTGAGGGGGAMSVTCRAYRSYGKWSKRNANIRIEYTYRG